MSLCSEGMLAGDCGIVDSDIGDDGGVTESGEDGAGDGGTWDGGDAEGDGGGS